MHNKLLDIFFQAKLFCLVHVQITSLFKIGIGMFQKEANFCYFSGMVIWETTLEGYPIHQDVADMSGLFYFIFVFIWSKDWRVYRDITFQSKMV